MYCKANFKSVAKCKKRLCTAVFALFKKNTRRVAWPVLQSRCKALSALSQNTLKNTKTGRKSVGFLILTQAPKCTRSHCFPPQKHPKNGFVMRFAGKNSFFQLRARDFSFYMNAYNGLVYGAVRGRRACVYDKKEVCAVQRGLRFAPRSTVLTALFVLCAVYLLFISMQAKYLFGAFWGALPEGFSYSEYARQGFFELCRVAAINIVILLAANVMSRAQAAENCLLRVCNTALSALTLLLLATAAAKMALYIAAYGLTVKRVLASVFLVWMACVFVCVILRQFRTVALVRVAVFLGAVLFALLCVLPVGDGISTYNAARVQVGTLDPDVMEQELRPLV